MTTAMPDFAPAPVAATIPPVPVPTSERIPDTEELFAKKVACYLIPAVVWAMVVVGVYCRSGIAYREPGELLLVVLGTMLGSISLTFVVRAVTGHR